MKERVVNAAVVGDPGSRGATPTKFGWGCAARFPKTLPYL